MAGRIVNWHILNNNKSLASFYMEQDYTPERVRIYAEDAPTQDFEVDIKDDGTSIFDNRAASYREPHIIDSIILYGTLATSTFRDGEIITGGTSGATAIAQENSRFGTLRVRLIRDTVFTAAETITGGDSSATAVVGSFTMGTDGFLSRSDSPKTTIVLAAGDNLEENAENFPRPPSTIEEGSVLTCHVIKMGSANNVTVQLELSLAEEGDD